MKYFTLPKYNTAMIVFAVILAFLGGYSDATLIHVLNWLVVAYFVFESVFKIKSSGWKNYLSNAGNRFDFSIVVISSAFLFLPNEALDSVVYLRIFRAMSLAKIIRLMPDAERILNGLIRATRASKTILMLLAIQLAFFSLLGFTLFSSVVPEYFGDPLRSMNTIFGIFTVENWGAIPEAAKELDEPYIYYAVNGFVITVLILGGFIALSLANAIFVDEMAIDNNDNLIKEVAELKEELSEIKDLLKRRSD